MASDCLHLPALSPTGNAIQAFGNGTDVNLSPKNPSFQATQAPRVEKTPSLPDDLSDSTSLGTSIITTCTSIQVSSAAGEGSRGQAEGLERHHAVEGGCGELADWGPGMGARVPPSGLGPKKQGRTYGGLFFMDPFTRHSLYKC